MAGNDGKTRRLKHQRLLASYTLAVGSAVASALFLMGDVVGLRVNFTPSEPLGLWQVVPLDRPLRVGDFVFICPPDTPVMREARLRGYLWRGGCKGNYAPLLKSIAALPGHHIAVANSVEVDGNPLAHSELRRVDRFGKPLEPYTGAVVPFGQIFVHSPYDQSFDSRYFGPIPAINVIGLAQCLNCPL